MKCVTPLWLGSRGYVPCGHCYACSTNNRNSWDLRLRVEFLNSKFSSFVTLTYNPESLPENLCVYPPHHNEFIKNLRSKFRDVHFRYYSVGEYGEKYGRPHYHYLFFYDKDIDFIRAVSECWPYGFTDVGTVTKKSIHYVTKWHINPKERVKGESLERHGFTRQSKGIGRDLIDQFNFDNISPTYYIDGVRLPVSRYYRKKIGFEVTNVEDLYTYVKRKYKLTTDKQVINKLCELQKIYSEKLKNPRKSLF